MSPKKRDDSKSESKRKRSESPGPTPAFNKEQDLSGERDGEHKNKRVRFERAASPTHSHLSLGSDWSMDLPTNFKGRGAFPLDSRERAASPTHSYLSLRTDWSMDLPTNFKGREGLYLNTRIQSDRASSPTLSSVSEWTEGLVEQPTSSKAEATFHLDPRLLTENHLKCPVCKTMLKDPVSIPCGHNYCRDCINTFWDSCTQEYVCPECGRGSKTRPELNTNTALAEVVKNLQQAGFSPALPPSSYAGPEDVACDFCSERRLKAVKSCSTCDVFLCETHIRNHYTIPALQKHTLCDVTKAMEKKLSQQLLRTDSSFSKIATGNQNHTDKTQDIKKEELGGNFLESVLNAAKLKMLSNLTKRPKKALRSSRPKTRVNEDNTNVQSLKFMYSTLQQEVSGLKKSILKFSRKKKTEKEKYYDEDDKDYGEEDDDDYHENNSDSSDEEEEEDGGDDYEDDEGDNYDDEKDSADDYDRDASERSDEEDNGDEEDNSDDYDRDASERSYEKDNDDEEDNSDDYDRDASERSDEEDNGDEEDNSDDYDRDASERSDEEDNGDEEDNSDDYDRDASERFDEEDRSERSDDKSSYDSREDGDDYSDYDY